MATTQARPTDRARFARAIAAGVAAAATLLYPLSTAPEAGADSTLRPAYGWPVKPFHRQHPVRGFFGDPRIGMTPKGMHSGFHFGIDISCPNGTPVYATLDGTVRLESFRPETVAVVGSDGTEFEYWHIRPAVANRQHVVAYRTIVGFAEPPWEHVHFSERRNGVYVNPLRPGALGPFVDRTQPRVKQLRAETDGKVVRAVATHGTVDLLVEAYDDTPVRVHGPWGGKPITPSRLEWRLTTTTGRVVRPWRTSIDHSLRIPSDDRFSEEYGRWTRQNKKHRIGRYRLVLANGWDTRTVADGRYVVEVAASDVSGNRAVASFAIRIANGAARV